MYVQIVALHMTVDLSNYDLHIQTIALMNLGVYNKFGICARFERRSGVGRGQRGYVHPRVTWGCARATGG